MCVCVCVRERETETETSKQLPCIGSVIRVVGCHKDTVIVHLRVHEKDKNNGKKESYYCTGFQGGFLEVFWGLLKCTPCLLRHSSNSSQIGQ